MGQIKLAGIGVAIMVFAGTPCVAHPGQDAPNGVARSSDYNEVVGAYRTGQTRKIVGGQLAPVNAYPWQVSLQVSWIADPGAAHFCGGSIYKANWIITAAHCTLGLVADDVVVTAGTNSLNPGIRRINVRRIIQHSGYSDSTKDNDIALLELAKPIELSNAARAIPLVSEQEEAAFTAATSLVVTGWGATQSGGDTVRDLRHVTVDYVPLAICNQPLSYNGRITTRMLCAGPAGGGQDSCQGDSGGPLASGVAGATKLVGVVSWGEGCAVPLKYGIYARITSFSTWIMQNAQ